MDNKTFTYALQIKESHLDTFGHVNNATYLMILEEARWELITENHYGLEVIKKTGLGPVILEIHIKFLKELCLRDEILIQTKLISYKNKIAKLEQKILRHHELCCEAEFVFGLFDLSSRQLVMPTKEWLYAVGYDEANQS